jgi:ABC-type sugar transport system ATPase subunit
MAVFMEGQIQQIGRPSEVFARPNSVDVAAFIGSPPMNLIPGQWVDGSVMIEGYKLEAPHRVGGSRDVIVGIRPGALRIEAAGIPAVVDLVEDLGDTAVLDLSLGATTVRARLSDGPIPKEGESVFVTARPNDIHLFDAATRKRL